MAYPWSLQDALKYLLEDAELKEVQTSEVFGKIANPYGDFLVALEYQGFDPRIIIRQLIRNRASYMSQKPELKQWDLANVEAGFAIRNDTKAGHIFGNHEALSKDLKFLTMTFLFRKNHISKITLKCNAGLAEILEMLKTKYDINDAVRKSGSTLGSTDVTLPRIAGVLPSVAVRMYHDKVVKEIVPFLSIPGTNIIEPQSGSTTDEKPAEPTVLDISHAVCCPFLPSLHPRDSAAVSNIHALMLYVAVKLDDIIHKKEKNFTSLADLMTYYKTRYESAATPEKCRVEIMRKIGLMANGSNDFVPAVKAVNTACFKALESMREDDEYHTTFMAVARTGQPRIQNCAAMGPSRPFEN